MLRWWCNHDAHGAYGMVQCACDHVMHNIYSTSSLNTWFMSSDFRDLSKNVPYRKTTLERFEATKRWGFDERYHGGIQGCASNNSIKEAIYGVGLKIFLRSSKENNSTVKGNSRIWSQVQSYKGFKVEHHKLAETWWQEAMLQSANMTWEQKLRHWRQIWLDCMQQSEMANLALL
jgi:hypothetical protein